MRSILMQKIIGCTKDNKYNWTAHSMYQISAVSLTIARFKTMLFSILTLQKNLTRITTTVYCFTVVCVRGILHCISKRRIASLTQIRFIKIISYQC